MNIKQFINQKAPQLAYYLKGFWEQRIPYRELDLYFWDTLEEWHQHAVRPDYPYTQKERVFWHVLHQMHFWPEDTLSNDRHLKDELSVCLQFLEDEGYYCPLDCIGIRP
ncbi:hypothetical protein [Bowmanella sp. JS7-9]|uniref:Uncharacterized protein n=1 Tax=Pseudobowmanella zhangzhouensis TaxID=1537679 RepID=A0ABW1XQA2_9ALTE|nr:hypothetical protein [Bowmanella sp. JS7-9]TBX21511.1 hypothetical protein TK45_11480 [Bowmanella sp. JS7-9]